MRVKVIVLILVLSLSTLPFPSAEAQIGAPDVNLTCSSGSGSGTIDVEVYPGATLTGTSYCIASNPNSYQEKIEIEVQADGLVVAHPGSLTLAANAEVEFIVTVRADEGMSVQSRSMVVKATVTEAMGVPPPNIAEKEVNLIINILQFSEVQLVAVDSIVTLGAKVDYNLEFKVYNQGNGVDKFLLEMTESYRSILEDAGFNLVLPMVSVELEPLAAPTKVRLQIRTPSHYEDWPINSDGDHEMSFTLEFMATSDFSCKYELRGCNTESVRTTITIYEEARETDKYFSGTTDSTQMLIYGGSGAGVILLLILFVMLRKGRNSSQVKGSKPEEN